MDGKIGKILSWVVFLAAAGWLTLNYNRAVDDLSEYQSAGPGSVQGAAQSSSSTREMTAEEEWEYEAAQADSVDDDWGTASADDY